MWYKNSFRRHLCDMHIADWNDSFLTELSPETYVENLKKAKIKSAMIYFQSHAGLCYWPTKTGKLHNGFSGREDTVRRLTELCHREGIDVIGYYSLIYNTWAEDKYPSWRIVNKEGTSRRERNTMSGDTGFAGNTALSRYGLCCPNNTEYREFVASQIKEMSEYFKVDGMFYDMLFWPELCCCPSCQKRWADEVGGELPTNEDWNDPLWLLQMRKRREWMGEFAGRVTALTKELFGDISVEHNVAYSALPNSTTANCEEVIAACDYAGGDLYGDAFNQSLACKFYRSITNNQPFEYMFSRCAPNLSAHTQIKSKDIMRSMMFLTTANHGATLVIDAIDPVGTMDSRAYDRIGEVFAELIPYEPYLIGEPREDVGIYYSLKSKFSPHGEEYTNYRGVKNTVKTLVERNILCGITGGFSQLDRHKAIIAPALTCEDSYDNQRLIDYVKNGGLLYFSGSDNSGLLKEFFGAEVTGRTEERVVYLAPKPEAQGSFEYFNSERPLSFDMGAPIVSGLKPETVLATLTLPYTTQDTGKFASIHSNPPGIKTDIPAMATTGYGKGRVIWSAVSLEGMELYDYRKILVNLLKSVLGLNTTLNSNAPKDVEITVFDTDTEALVNTVLLNTEEEARRVESFEIGVECGKNPKKVFHLPQNTEVSCKIEGNRVTFESVNSEIFNMYKIQF